MGGAERAPIALKGSCYVTPEDAGLIKAVEEQIEGLRIETGNLPEGMVSVKFYGEKGVVWPFVWRAISDALSQERT